MTKNRPVVAITIDDFEWDTTPAFLPAKVKNQRMLDALRRHQIRSALFVNGQYIDEGQGASLLSQWDRAGHIIGNHTYSHNDFNDPKITLSAFAEDIWQNEEYLQPYRHFRRLFRYPFLHEGNTEQKREGLRRMLHRRGYLPAPITITTNDWAIDDRLRERLRTNPHVDIRPYRKFYLAHIQSRADFYENLAKNVVRRPVPHTILLHYTLLNALFLGDILQMFVERGWQFIDANDAFADSLFRMRTQFFPSNGSILWTLACERGKTNGLPLPDDYGKQTIAELDRAGL